MLIKKLTKLNLFIATALVFLVGSLVWIVLSAVNSGSSADNERTFPTHPASLTNEESIEKIYTRLQGFGFVLVERDERLKVEVALQSGGDEELVFELDAEILLVSEQGINVAFVSNVWLWASDYMLSDMIRRRSGFSAHLENAFQEEHGVEVDRIFFTLGRTAWSEEEREEHMEVIIQDLEQQIQDFIEQLE